VDFSCLLSDLRWVGLHYRIAFRPLIVCSVSVSMRRPNMLRFNSWTKECLECLEGSQYSPSSVEMLVAWVKLVKIAEDISACMSYDDPVNIPTPSDSRGRLMLKIFEKELNSWRQESSANSMNGIPLHRVQACHMLADMHCRLNSHHATSQQHFPTRNRIAR
jgi:hypothetical protein